MQQQMQSRWVQLQRADVGRWAYYLQSFFLPVLVAGLAWRDIWLPSLIILLISKWRALFFPPRFWPVTFRTSLVDLCVGGAYLFLQWRLLSSAYSPSWVQFVVAMVVMLAYMAWLVDVRHRETMPWHRIQGIIALASGMLVVDNLFTQQPLALNFIALSIIFYTCYRHLFFSIKEGLEHVRSLSWMLIAAQIWLVLSRYYIEFETGSEVYISVALIYLCSVYYFTSFLYDKRADGSSRVYIIGLGLVTFLMLATILGGGFGSFG